MYQNQQNIDMEVQEEQRSQFWPDPNQPPSEAARPGEPKARFMPSFTNSFMKIGLFSVKDSAPKARAEPEVHGNWFSKTFSTLFGTAQEEKKTVNTRDSGIALRESRQSFASSIDPNSCSVCEGKGTLGRSKCPSCKGSGIPNTQSKAGEWYLKTRRTFSSLGNWATKTASKLIPKKKLPPQNEEKKKKKSVFGSLSRKKDKPKLPQLPEVARVKRSSSSLASSRSSLDPGPASDWARTIEPEELMERRLYNLKKSSLTEEDMRMSSPKLASLYQDIQHGDEYDFTDLAIRHVSEAPGVD